MDLLKQYWAKVPVAVRKPLILIVGLTVILAGAAMLVLPGPGIVVIFLGLALLATEFTIAARIRDWSVHKVKSGINRAKHKQ
jgi:uncharacterized protein (TIGR02611 family)